jgi:hypothetical protein
MWNWLACPARPPLSSSTDTSCGTEFAGRKKGKRIIIIHAMTRNGMVEVELDIPSDTSDKLGIKCASAAVVSTTLSSERGDKADYHDTMNGAKFVS